MECFYFWSRMNCVKIIKKNPLGLKTSGDAGVHEGSMRHCDGLFSLRALERNVVLLTDGGARCSAWPSCP